MLSQDMSEKLRSIYDAAFAKNRWQTALDAMGSVTEAKGVLLYNAARVSSIRFDLNAASSVYAKLAQSSDTFRNYQHMVESGKGSGLDQEGASAVHSSPPFKALSDAKMWNIDSIYHQRPEILWSKEKLGVFRRYAINLSEDPLLYSGLIFHYERCFDNGIPSTDMRFSERLAPHMAKAIEMNRLMNGLRQKYQAVLSVLDRIDIAICILDDRGQLLLANRQCQALIDRQDGLTKSRDGTIKLVTDDHTARALDAVRRVSQTARGENDDTSEVLELPRRSKHCALYCMVSPLRDADMELEAGLHGTLLTIVDPERPVQTRVEAAAKAYGLTPAEERVAVLLAEGIANSEIAERLSVSPETVKSQIAAIFSKLQCRSRAACIWRIFQFSPPIL